MGSPTEPDVSRLVDRDDPSIITIVVGLDGSEPSLRALAYAVGSAQRANGRVVCAYVVPPASATAIALGMNTGVATVGCAAATDANEANADDLESLVESARRDLDVPITFERLHGDPGDALAEFATEVRADHVVIGAPRHPLGHLFTSVSRHLNRRPSWPLTVVP